MLAIVAAVILAAALIAGPGESDSAATDLAADRPPASAAVATVVHVTDGDTIVVELDGRRERVRFIGVDAPEIARPADGIRAECGGDAARRANEDLVAGRRVWMAPDESDRDRFGRLLRHVWVLEGDVSVMVGQRLVEIGAVEARSYPPDTDRDPMLAAAEDGAREAGAGIWGDC